MRHNDDLVVVDDSAIGAYFRVSLQGSSGPLIPLRRLPSGVCHFPAAAWPWISKALTSWLTGGSCSSPSGSDQLIGEDGLIAEYDSLLGEFVRTPGRSDLPSAAEQRFTRCGAVGRRVPGLRLRCH